MKEKRGEEMNVILENDLFEAFAEASDNVYIYVCDVSQDLSRWSMNAIEYFGLPGEYMMEAASVWLEKVHPEDRSRYIADIDAVFSGKQQKHKCEYRAMNRYGDYVWLECRGTMVYDDAHRPKIFAGMMTRLDARNKYDPLTNLKTFYEFNNLDFSSDYGTVLLIGIDNFRRVINNYGYSFGDVILQEFCGRLQDYCEGKRLLYRLEGDEFIIVSPHGSRTGTEKLFADIQRLGIGLGSRRNQLINIEVSGGAVFYPQDGEKREILITNMEHSLEHAKKYERGRMVFYSREIADYHNRKTMLIQELDRCVRKNCEGFELYFQPIVNKANFQVTSCEALLRWRTDDGIYGNIAEIIKILEQNGKINEVGRWVAEETFRQARLWQKEFGAFRVGFNVSYLQFKDSSFVDYLINKAKEYQVDPALINIELTESSKVDDFTYLAKCFGRLREFGFQISLDDFGIAYSTLLLLKSLPADTIKIDHSFVRGLSRENTVDLAIIESVVSLCRKLKINVVVEGVESAEILDIMNKVPVNYLQGYYFERPIPVHQFEEIILKQY